MEIIGEKKMRRLCFWVAAVVVLMMIGAGPGCKGEKKESTNELPTVAGIWFSSSLIQAGETITAHVTALDSENDPLLIEYQWYVNGKGVKGATGEVFGTVKFFPGDKVYVMARAVEIAGRRAGEWEQSKVMVLGDYPPLELSGVKIEPEKVFSYTPVRAVVDYGELDAMEVEVFYRWFVNGAVVEQVDNMSAELGDDYFEAGDRLEVWASTEPEFKSSVRKKSLGVVVANSPPRFTGSPRLELEGEVGYIYLTASDPDGDPLEFFLEKGPAAVSLEDPQNGTIRIEIGELAPGRHQISFGVKDDRGGRVLYSTHITAPKKEE